MVEPTESVVLKFYNFRGGATGENPETGESIVGIGIGIVNDDLHPVPPLIANDDYVTYIMNRSTYVYTADNDFFDPHFRLRNTDTTILRSPQHGMLLRYDLGSAPAYFYYTPEPDYAGPDSFDYRMCKEDGIECIEATVYLRGALSPPFVKEPGRRSDGFILDVDALPALSDARFVSSTLGNARFEVLQTGVDTTPHLAWDSSEGMAWITAALPASPDGQTREHRVRLDYYGDERGVVDLRLGIDANGDGLPSPDQQGCLFVDIQSGEPVCHLSVPIGPEPVTYWVALHSRLGEPLSNRVAITEMLMRDPDSKLRVTGPARAGRHESLRLMASWIDTPALAPMLGVVEVMDGATKLGEFELVLHGGDGPVLLPVDGTPVTVGLLPSSEKPTEERELFFDVPPGGQSLTMTVGADAPIAFAPHRFGFEQRDVSRVRASGEHEPAASYVAVAAGQTGTVTVDDPVPGRWHALVRNAADQRAQASITVDVEATLPPVRPGSYFNPVQPGHGLFLYPAGNQWAGLWYTYNHEGPTLYYLQAAQPGDDGIWRATIIRSTWNGTQAYRTDVGLMQVTPLSEREFVMSYIVDGHAGSQVVEALGSGCPWLNGAPLDISSHWFDPARAGNGYSVQTWQDGYQFFAAFTYDSRGYPIFLAAERAGLGGDIADLELQALCGSCPTGCDYLASTRQPAGILRRVLSGGSLAEVSLDVDFIPAWDEQRRETFTITDIVQLLGGLGSTQSCAP